MITTEGARDPALHGLVGGQRVGVGNSAFQFPIDLLELLDALLFYGRVAQGAALARLDDARDRGVREARGLVHEHLRGRGYDWGHGCWALLKLFAVLLCSLQRWPTRPPKMLLCVTTRVKRYTSRWLLACFWAPSRNVSAARASLWVFLCLKNVLEAKSALRRPERNFLGRQQENIADFWQKGGNTHLRQRRGPITSTPTPRIYPLDISNAQDGSPPASAATRNQDKYKNGQSRS